MTPDIGYTLPSHVAAAAAKSVMCPPDLISMLRTRAVSEREAPALDFVSESLTFGELWDYVGTTSTVLAARGVVRGDIVPILSENNASFVCIWFGLLRIGAIPAFINWLLPTKQLAALLDSLSPRTIAASSRIVDVHRSSREVEAMLNARAALWVDTPYREWLERQAKHINGRAIVADEAPRDGAEIAGLLHTGGTTGEPKFCMLSDRYYIRSGRRLAVFSNLQSGERLFGATPLFHVNAQLCLLMPGILAGSRTRIEPAFSATTFWDRTLEVEPDVISLHFAPAKILAERAIQRGTPPVSSRSVRAVILGTANFAVTFKIPELITGYGSTELGLTHLNRWSTESFADLPTSDLAQIDQNVGRAPDDLETAIRRAESLAPRRRSGEILVRPTELGTVFSGYLNNISATAAATKDYWYRTGDEGYIDEAGNLHFLGRIDERLRTGGEWVDPTVIEALVAGAGAGVRSCVVTGLRQGTDDRLVLLVEGDDVDIDKIRATCHASLPNFMIPHSIFLIDEIPRSPGTHKVRLDAVQQIVRRLAEADTATRGDAQK